MIGYTNINEYITYLIDNQNNINIIEFVKEINKLKYNIDISFIDEFIELVDKNECCIHYNMLQKYGILSNNNISANFKDLINRHNFIEKEDYLLLNVQEQLISGTKYKKEYYLHPRAFKMCLMRSLKTKQYAKYYLLLEECIKYFNDYQNLLKEKFIIKLKDKNKENKIIIKEKDNKIDQLEEKINTILENNKKILENNEELLKSNKHLENKLNKVTNQNNDLLDSVEDLKDDNEEINNKLDITIKKLDISTDERVINPNNNQKLENFIIFKSRKKNIEYKYYVIRCQIRNTLSKVKRLEDDKYKNILEINNITNSIKFWNYIKEKYKNNLIFENNKFNIIDIDEKVLLNNINTLYNNRKNINLDTYEDLED